MIYMGDSASYTGDTLIVANPGTGKTTALANRVVELLKEGAREEDMLCVTFTEKAAAEMRERVSSAIKAEGLKASVANIAIHTFHSYANSYLESIGESKEIVGNNFIRYSIFKSFLKDNALNYGKDYIISDIVPRTENAIRYLKSFGILPSSVAVDKARKELERIYSEEEITNVTLEENMKFMDYFLSAFSAYESEKDNSKGYMDYNDMLIRFIKKYDPKAKRYKFVMVDELQDVNELEAEIAIASGDSLFLVGDRKQAIFGFQGGSTKNFSNFTKRKGMKKETKTLNYRSLQGVLDYSKTHFLKHTADRSHEEELAGLSGNRKGKAKVSVVTAKSPESAAVAKLMDLVGKQGGKVERKIAIITRTNGQIVKMSSMLDGKGIEFATTAGGSTNEKAKDEIVAYIRGILYDDAHSIVPALFTPFSGVTLKEAFEISETIKKDEKTGLSVARSVGKAFFAEKESFTIDRLPDLFLKKIIPISVSIGKEYYLTATSIYRSTEEFFRIVSRPDRDSFFDYLSITEEDYEPIGGEKPVTLTTVHKAKGREFDTVIYLPMEQRDKVSFIDAVVYAIIKSSKGVDIREELEEEHLRVDFVAFTRAKDELYIVSRDKQCSRYLLDGLSEQESYDSDATKEPESWKYDQAYAMFVSGRRDAASQAITNKEIWLREIIDRYFSKVQRLSYTMVDEMDDPYSFLKKYILCLGEYRGEGLRIGTKVHEIAEEAFKNAANAEPVPEQYVPYVENIKKVRAAIEEKYKGKQIEAELVLTKDLDALFPSAAGTGLQFKAKIDAIYETPGGAKKYLILDYKTDKTNEHASDHRRQLAVYKRVYAKEKGIKDEDIAVAIGFIGLRGKINTNTVGWELDDADCKAVAINTFEKRLKNCLAYKKDPQQFVADLLETESDEPLYGRLTRELKETKTLK
jgi:DNA helicase II / ATP-dependent DNA helicase PcrA